MCIKCHFCETTQPDVPAAIQADWIPDFWDEQRGQHQDSPVCLACSVFVLAPDADYGGEPFLPVPLAVVTPGTVRPINAHRWEMVG